MAANIIQVLIIVFFPYLCIVGVKRFKIDKWLSPIVLCYAMGILLANLKLFSINETISTTFGEGCIILALPLLLYATNIVAWFKHAQSSILSFVLCILSGVFSSLGMAYLFKDNLEDTWMLSGMLVGVYTGGTANLQAIGMAVGAEESTYILLNAADTLCSGIYLLMLTSFLPILLSKFLPKFKTSLNQKVTASQEEATSTVFAWQEIGEALFVTLSIIAVSVGLTYLLFGDLKNVGVLILLLTTFSIFASLSDRIRNLRGSFEVGEYFLLMFCVAIGMLTDFSLLMEDGMKIFLYTALVLSSTITLHYVLSRFFRIDRDTAMITSTAAVFGPVFVGQVASVLKNREVIVSGIATGLVGMALGNYLGMGVAYLLKLIL